MFGSTRFSYLLLLVFSIVGCDSKSSVDEAKSSSGPPPENVSQRDRRQKPTLTKSTQKKPVSKSSDDLAEYKKWLQKHQGIVASLQTRQAVLDAIPVWQEAFSIQDEHKHLEKILHGKRPRQYCVSIGIGLTESPIMSAVWWEVLGGTHRGLKSLRDRAASVEDDSELDLYTVSVELSGAELPSDLILKHEGEHDVVVVLPDKVLQILGGLALSHVSDPAVGAKLAGVQKNVTHALIFVDFLDEVAVNVVFRTTGLEQTQRLVGLIQENWRAAIQRTVDAVSDQSRSEEQQASAALRLGELTTAFDTLDFVVNDKLLELRLKLPLSWTRPSE